jgi:hypothetical protein
MKLKFLADAYVKETSTTLESLEKDNSQIYFELIPSSSELNLPERKFSNSMEEITKFEVQSGSELKFFVRSSTLFWLCVLTYFDRIFRTNTIQKFLNSKMKSREQI